MIMVIHSKTTSKCGNLLDTPRYLPRTPHPCNIHPTSSYSTLWFPPTTRLQYLPLPLGRFGQRDASPAIQPVFHPTTCRDGLLPLRCIFIPTSRSYSLPSPVKHGARACVRRMRACERWPCALVRERSCNNNKKRATLWGTNGLRPVHPMLGGAGLILYPQWLSIRGAEDVDISISIKVFELYTK